MNEDKLLKLIAIIFIVGLIFSLLILVFKNDEVETSEVHDTCIVYRNELYCKVELYE